MGESFPVAAGNLVKMRSQLQAVVQYQLTLGQTQLAMNPLIGRTLCLQRDGAIHCRHCGRITRTSFQQGYCYRCFRQLPQCDRCMLRPEYCHYHLGTCRDPAWGAQHCFSPHIVYLANTSGLKVGITHHSQLPVRWIDQGAAQAVVAYRVSSRRLAGLIEHCYAEHIADRTNWRAMLKGAAQPLPLAQLRRQFHQRLAGAVAELSRRFPDETLQVGDDEPVTIHYPIARYPDKVIALNLDKQPRVQGTLLGIKGQYLLFDCGVVNVRKFTAYPVVLSVQ